MNQIKIESAPPDQLTSTLRRVQKWLGIILLVLFLFQLLGGWILRTNQTAISLPGSYWLMIGASTLTLPLILVSLIALLGFIISWIVLLVRRSSHARSVLTMASLMILATFGFVGTGIPSVFVPLTHEGSVTANGKTYLLSEGHGIDLNLRLFECDNTALFCKNIYSSGDLYVSCPDHTLSIDPATGGPVIAIKEGSPCGPAILYPPD
jgi:hypothetical protein